MLHPERLGLITDRFIELFGNRTGDTGDSLTAGLAWIHTTRLILLATDEEGLPTPADWHHLHRLLRLAHRLHRPILLWNISFRLATISQPPIALKGAIQESQIQLVKSPLPLIGVYDSFADHGNLECELAIFDVALLIGETPASDRTASLSPNTRIISPQMAVKGAILNALDDVSAISVERLVSQRLNRVRKTATCTD